MIAAQYTIRDGLHLFKVMPPPRLARNRRVPIAQLLALSWLAIPVALREPLIFEAFYGRMGQPGVVDRTYAALKEKVFCS